MKKIVLEKCHPLTYLEDPPEDAKAALGDELALEAVLEREGE